MIRGLYSSYSGMKAMLLKQDVVAANLANADSVGYKEDFAVIQAYPRRELTRVEGRGDPVREVELGAIGDGSGGSLVGGIHTDFSQGPLRETGRRTDLALEGEGFFVVRDESGASYYTRAGNFHLDSEGRLVTPEGRFVLGEDGNPIQVGDGTLEVLRDGSITVDGEPRGKLMLAAFADTGSLTKVGDGLFSGTGAGPATGVAVHQGYLESSNVDAVEQMVAMIVGFRTYQSNQRLVQVQDRTLERLINEVGRV